ncbi:hypothetical protein CHS0354_015462 [Potamilus streckersoni]|uniref:Uncharacterized protein n=1 Tax=Potamilus streckersoni TaxID=2493646 RepID=A0AAE0RQL1_9BIVA|nr:hypothetical protein CHS0354_015462 [Potamilus streckersoni]
MSSLTERSTPTTGIGTPGKIPKMDGRFNHATDRIRILRTAVEDRVHRLKSRTHSAILPRRSYIRPESAPIHFGQSIRSISVTLMKEQILFEERKQASLD